MDWPHLACLLGDRMAIYLSGGRLFLLFCLGKGYENANQDFRLNFLVLVFEFPLFIFHDNGSHFTRAEIIAFFESHGTTQIRAPISHLSSVGLIERNVQLVISQVRK